VDQEQLVARRLGVFDRLGRERRREEHVVERDRAAPAFALLLAREEQLLGARVGDQQLAVGVGEQNRVGDRVDDRREQRALVREPPLGAYLGRPLVHQLL